MARNREAKKSEISTAAAIIAKLNSGYGDSDRISEPYERPVAAPLEGVYYDATRGEVMGEIDVFVSWQYWENDGSYTVPFILPLSEVKKVAETGPEKWQKHFAYLVKQMEERGGYAIEEHARLATEAAERLGTGSDSAIEAPAAANFRRRSAPKP